MRYTDQPVAMPPELPGETRRGTHGGSGELPFARRTAHSSQPQFPRAGSLCVGQRSMPLRTSAYSTQAGSHFGILAESGLSASIRA